MRSRHAPKIRVCVEYNDLYFGSNRPVSHEDVEDVSTLPSQINKTHVCWYAAADFIVLQGQAITASTKPNRSKHTNYTRKLILNTQNANRVVEKFIYSSNKKEIKKKRAL